MPASPTDQILPAAAPTAVEFFAGIGLVKEGLERGGVRVVWASDYDTTKQALYGLNHGGGHFHLADIREVSAYDIPRTPIATASFPCTDLSLAGAMAGLAAGQSSMLWEFFRILEEAGDDRPPIVMLANVPSLASSHGGRDMEALLEALTRLGYASDVLILDAARWVPQSRVRLFVIAYLHDRPNPSGLEATDARPAWLSELAVRRPHLRLEAMALPALPEASAGHEIWPPALSP